MPTLPKKKKRHWIPSKSRHTRQVDNSAFYNSKAWRMTRKFYIKNNPLCEECKRQSPPIIKAANVVDHIKAITFGGDKLDYSNLQSLCTMHHNSKSASEGIEYRKGIKDYERKK